MTLKSLPQNWSEILNHSCHCFDDQGEKNTSEINQRLKGLTQNATQFSSFSNAPVFLGKVHHRKMIDLISAVDQISRTQEFQELVASRQPDLPRTPHLKTTGLMMGFDFHITPDGPRLIEINTNAGGAFISKMLGGRTFDENVCAGKSEVSSEAAIEQLLINSFRLEFEKARPNQDLKTVAIVDEKPESQFLYSDTLLAKQLLFAHGFEAHICDITELEHHDQAVFYRGSKVDLVYNRHTDFMLSGPDCAKLRAAFIAGDVVVSPSPVHHATYADKRNLAFLSGPALLDVNEQTRASLAIIPRTQVLDPKLEAEWWSKRKKYFFKPKDGFGGRAVYRGDKVTKNAWNTIATGDYIAQEFVPPSIRETKVKDVKIPLKYDIRVFAYAGEPLFTVARVYQGQTTNFRTQGGGFSEVIVI